MKPLIDYSIPQRELWKPARNAENIQIYSRGVARSASENHVATKKLQQLSSNNGNPPSHNLRLRPLKIENQPLSDPILHPITNVKSPILVNKPHAPDNSVQLNNKLVLNGHLSLELPHSVKNKAPLKSEISMLSTQAKKSILFNGKHVEKDILDQAAKFRKKVNYNPYEEDENFKLSFTHGYNPKTYDLCLEMLANENDIYILEGNFPGQYTEYLKALELPKAETNNLSVQTPSEHGHLPSIDRQTLSSKSIVSASRFGSVGQQPDNILDRSLISVGSTSKASDFSGSTRTLMLGKFFERKTIIPPPLPLETFVNSLAINSPHGYNSEFFYICANNKFAKTSFGFAEIIFPEAGKRVGVLSKLYISRIYRKIKRSVYIYGKLVHMLFQTFKLDRISANIVAKNQSQNDDLKTLGFKLDKFLLVHGVKVVVLTIKRNEFYENST